MNRYPTWKYLLILIILVVGAIYALPNLYGDDPALQIAGSRTTTVTGQTERQVENTLQKYKLDYKSIARTDKHLLVRFHSTETQLAAADRVRTALGSGYTVAMNLVPATPKWLRDIGALPMYLGLDLRGGLHFLMQVDMNAVVKQTVERNVSDLRSVLREHKIRYLTVIGRDKQVQLRFRDAKERDKAETLIHQQYRDLVLKTDDSGDEPMLYATLSKKDILDAKSFAIKQNITTLRNRVNEVGVAEPLIQQQGEDQIVVELPGVQDSSQVKDLLGATATLEYHMVDEDHDVQDALDGRVPFGSRIYYDRSGRPVLLKQQVIVTGDQIIDASSGFDQRTNQPTVNVTLDSNGARRMSDTTRDNIGKQMAVVYIENKNVTKMVDGKPKRVSHRIEQVISVAVIRDHFSKRFQTTGLASTEEAHTLALLLRAGALAAPMQIVEERTVGPSLGKDNISQGFRSVVIGFVLVLAFMAFWYKGFGMVANLALALNLVLIVAILSLLQATLTMPGIAGIVLTIGMAVDANVLIYERIREELRAGNTPQASIFAGYEKAFGTIADSNITTLIAAVVLFGFGTGPVKGFAVTLSVGIITSMFTAIMVTRAVTNLILGGKKISRLSI